LGELGGTQTHKRVVDSHLQRIDPPGFPSTFTIISENLLPIIANTHQNATNSSTFIPKDLLSSLSSYMYSLINQLALLTNFGGRPLLLPINICISLFQEKSHSTSLQKSFSPPPSAEKEGFGERGDPQTPPKICGFWNPLLFLMHKRLLK
jgi:hypothetical protein